MKREFVIILDNIRSLLNVGSIFRTAEAIGFKKIYLGGITPAPDSPRHKRIINKTALGAEEFLPWEKSYQTLKILKKLKKEGFYLIALELHPQSISLNSFKKLFKKHKKIALIIGNETKGIHKRYLDLANKIIKIPMEGKKESLNVAVAFGIAAFWLKNLK